MPPKPWSRVEPGRLGRRQLAALVLLAAWLPVACGGGADAEPASPAPPGPAALATCGLDGFASLALTRINAERATGASCGASGSFGPAAALVWSSQLDQAASGQAQDLLARELLSHTDAQGRDAAQRIAATGYDARLVAENIAGGPYTVDAVVDAWMASAPHCANLMNPQLQHMALACAARAGSRHGHYWVLNLAQPR